MALLAARQTEGVAPGTHEHLEQRQRHGSRTEYRDVTQHATPFDGEKKRMRVGGRDKRKSERDERGG